MTFQVTESANGGHILREIKVGVRVFPGAAVLTSTGRQVDNPFTLDELGPVVVAMQRQVALVYRQFTAPLQSMRRHQVTYRFRFGITATQNPVPVAYSEPTGTGYRAVGTSDPGVRSHASAMREAMAASITNVAIAYRSISGAPCAPRLTPSGTFEAISQSRRHPGTLDPVSNTIVVCGPDLLRANNQTFAHEVGHLLGMADWNFPGAEIMCRPHLNYPVRRLTPRVQNRLHDSANFQRPGRIGGPIEDLGQLTNPDAR